jgi:nitroreductase
MDFETVVKRRRMCREFLEREVPQENIDRILDLASRYPSAGHTEPQEFIVVRDQRVKHDLARAALDQMFVAQAPVVIVVVSDVRRRHIDMGSEEFVSSASSTGLSSRCLSCLRW